MNDRRSGKGPDAGTRGRGDAARRDPSRTQHGFTLLEVLLAMAILSVILTVIYSSFSTAGRNVEEAEKIRDESDLARILITRISDEIANAYLHPGMNSPVMLTIFYGKKEERESGGGPGEEKIRHDSVSLTMLTDPTWRTPGTKEIGLWEVGYFFREKPDGKGYTLFRREKRELNKDTPALDGGVEYEITDRVESLQFTYSQDGAVWTDNGWDSRSSSFGNKLPKAVEIAIAFDTGKRYTTRVDVGNSQ